MPRTLDKASKKLTILDGLNMTGFNYLLTENREFRDTSRTFPDLDQN